MRRASLTPMTSQGSCCQEPLIVVEESGCQEEEENQTNNSSPRYSLDIDSPQNPYLLSPWRDPRETRKHSLPTPSCTSGITASQVRRLSERGGEGSGPSPREAAFLATLSQAPAPQPGGRRHSVVTISKVPPALFGRNRRESVAALPTCRTRGGPPATDRRGSAHNLQLDIMDDIVTARKVRMKLWNTSSERVCEVQPLDETEATTSRPPQRYTKAGRRYSDFIPPPIPPTRRRASEQPPTNRVGGIVCTDNDLITILSNLTSSATEINRCDEAPPPKTESSEKQSLESKRSKMKNNRSNSFDASVLHGVNINKTGDSSEKVSVSPSSWFIKRHQTLAKKKDDSNAKPSIPFAKEFRSHSLKLPEKISPNIPKVVWDKPTGSVVDAQVLGSAIEVFLRQTGGGEGSAPPTTQQPPNGNKLPKPGPSSSTLKSKSPTGSLTKGQAAWYSNKAEEEEAADSCDTSLCSTLKDLFVK